MLRNRPATAWRRPSGTTPGRCTARRRRAPSRPRHVGGGPTPRCRSNRWRVERSRTRGEWAGTGACRSCGRRVSSRRWPCRHLGPDPRRDRRRALGRRERHEHRRQVAALRRRVALHDAEVGVHQVRDVDLVDHEQVRAGHAGPALARHLVAAGDVEHEQLHVDEPLGEREREVVAAALDEHQVERTLPLLEVLDGVEVGGDVLADGGVGAAAGLDRDDAAGVEDAPALEGVGVLGRVDVVGHHADAQRRRTAARTARRRARSCRCRPVRRCRRGTRRRRGRGAGGRGCGRRYRCRAR